MWTGGSLVNQVKGHLPRRRRAWRAYHPRLVRNPAIASSRYLAGRTVRRTSVASYEGYCVKCREKRQFEGQEVELANGRRAAQGTCPTCGTKMNRILGKKTT